MQISGSSAREPSTLVVGATGVGLGLVLGGLTYFHTRWEVLAMAVVVLAATAVFVRVLAVRVGLAVLLIVTSLIDRFTFPLGNVDIRPEQIAALAAGVFLVVVVRVRDRSILSLRPNLIESLLLAWFALGLVSSLVGATNRGHSVKILALLMVSSLALFVPRHLLDRRPEELDRVVRWLLLALAGESVYAVLAYFLHIFGPTISLSINRAHWSAYGTLWEPNVLGAMSAAGAVAWAFLGRRYFTKAWIGVLACLAACGVSFARTAWLALIVVLLLALATPVRRRLDLRNLGLAALVMLVVVAGILAAEIVGSYAPGYGGGTIKGGTLGDVTNPNDVVGRLSQIQPVLDDLKKRPIFGSGIDSFGERHVTANGPDYLGNLELAVVNDTGLIGLLVFAAFLFAILVATWRARHDPTVLGLGAMLLVIAITNQSTKTVELMITWLLIGLLLAAIQASTPSRRPASVHTAPGTGS
jgi:O-antigen ligase